MTLNSRQREHAPSDNATTHDERIAHQPYLGRRLRSLRRSTDASIAQVAAETGLSASFLSLVESGKSDISIGRMIKLANFYGVGFSDLIPHHLHRTPEIIRAGEHPELEVDDDHMQVLLLTAEAHRSMQPTVVTFAPGGFTKDHLQHPGDVLLYVIIGELTLEVEGFEPTVLRGGDSAYLERGMRRRYRNDGNVPVTYVGVVGETGGIPSQQHG
jgi:quercetin dioxygenase-like cupin family protein